MHYSSPAYGMGAAGAASSAAASKTISIITIIVVVGTTLFIIALAVGFGVGFGVGGKTSSTHISKLSAPIVTCDASATCGCATTKPSFSSRIINGDVATLNSWPWMVYLTMNNVRTCTGFLISPRHVLTAATCIAPYAYNITVNLGTNAYQFTYGGVNITNATALTAISVGDIAVITLAVNITYSATVKPCCITSNPSIPAPGDVHGVIAGWGETSTNSLGVVSPTLRQAVVQVQNVSSCSSSGNDTLCASYGSISTCPIDAGGPLMIANNNLWTCVGIITGRTSGCTNPITFTRIASYAIMIQNVTGIPVNY